MFQSLFGLCPASLRDVTCAPGCSRIFETLRLISANPASRKKSEDSPDRMRGYQMPAFDQPEPRPADPHPVLQFLHGAMDNVAHTAARR